MKKEPSVFLQHILESIEAIEEYVKNERKRDFVEDRKGQDAVIRRLEIIGEAVKNLSPVFTKNHPSVPWNKIAKMRDKLIHAYFGVDLDLTYDVVKKDIPLLKKEIKNIIRSLEK